MSRRVVYLDELSAMVKSGARIKSPPLPPVEPIPDFAELIARAVPRVPTAAEIVALLPPPQALPVPVIDVAGSVAAWMAQNGLALRGGDGVGILDITIERDFLVFKLSDGRVIRLRLPRGGGAGGGSGGATITVTAADLAIRRVTADYVTIDTDDIILVNSSSQITVTLTGHQTRRRPYHVKRMGTGNVLVQPQAGTLDGDPYKTINTRYTALSVIPDTTDLPNWIIPL